MGLPEFISKLSPDPTEPVSHLALSELSGLTAADASALARLWASWPPDRLRSVMGRLAGMAEDDTALDFEIVFDRGLASADSDIRRRAVAGLAESTDRALVARFAEMLERDPAYEVRLTVAAALVTLSDLAAAGRLHPRDAARLKEAMTRVASDNAEKPELRLRALETAAVFGGEAISALVLNAHSAGDAASLRSALFAMGRTGDIRWLKTVLLDLDAPDADARTEAVAALGEIGDEAHAALITPALDDTDLAVQLAAVATLEKLGGATARKLLKQAADSPEPSVSTAARAALAGLDDEDNLSEVIGPEVRESGMFGTPHVAKSGLDDEDEDEDYDAASREGWSAVDLGGPGQDEGDEEA